VKEFAGYCHGGPWAGHRFVSTRPWVRVELGPKFDTIGFDVNAPIDSVKKIKTGIYNWESKADCWVWDGTEL
jgi:hypothetical protein